MAKPKKQKAGKKVSQAENYHGGLRRWAFSEIKDPWDVKNAILNFVKGMTSNA